jgi:hypothetical protein
MASAFLSHNSRDKRFVRKLADRLDQSGVTVWLDEVNLSIGDSIIEEISQAIQEVEYVVAIISNNSATSHWVQKELNLAVTKEIAGSTKVILPVVIDDCELPATLRDKLYADFRNRRSKKQFEEQSLRLLEAMGVKSSQQEKHQAFFSRTSESVALDGEWKVIWFTVNANGQRERYKIHDPYTGSLIPYPAERATITTTRAKVSCVAYDPTTENEYWLEGRISSRNQLTLTYWSVPDGSESRLTGTVYLDIAEDSGKPLMLTGWWRGYTRDDQITEGEVEFTKVGSHG